MAQGQRVLDVVVALADWCMSLTNIALPGNEWWSVSGSLDACFKRVIEVSLAIARPSRVE